MAEEKGFAVKVEDLLRMVGKRCGRGAETEPGAASETQQRRQELAELELQNAQLRKAAHSAEEALEKYLALYNDSPASCLTLDSAGTIGNANLTFAALMGLPRAGLIGLQFDSFLTEASRDTFAALLAREFAGPGRANCQLTLRNGADTPLLVQVEAATSGDQWLVVLIEISRPVRGMGEQVVWQGAQKAARTS